MCWFGVFFCTFNHFSCVCFEGQNFHGKWGDFQAVSARGPDLLWNYEDKQNFSLFMSINCS